jgi:hypothetical protein
MAKIVRYRTIRCACGNVLTRRNIRKSGMAVCVCGNNFAASQFEVHEDLPRHPRGTYARSSWDPDLSDWVLDDNGTYHRVW